MDCNAVLEINENQISAEMIAISYDWKAAVAQAESNGRPDWAPWRRCWSAGAKESPRRSVKAATRAVYRLLDVRLEREIIRVKSEASERLRSPGHWGSGGTGLGCDEFATQGTRGEWAQR